MCRYLVLLSACVLLPAGIVMAGEPGPLPPPGEVGPGMPAMLPAAYNTPSPGATQPVLPDQAVPEAAESQTGPQLDLPPDPPPPATAPPVGLHGTPLACVPCQASYPPVRCPCPTEEKECHDHFFASGEYLLWWIRDSKLPVLVTTGTTTSQGILGRQGTRVLFGGDSEDNEERSGARFRGGYWFESCPGTGIDASFFFLGERSQRFSASAATDRILARPFFNVNTGQETVQLTTFPGLSTDSISVSSASKLWGAEVNPRCRVCASCDGHFDLFAGFRYLDLQEKLDITEDLISEVNATDPRTGRLIVPVGGRVNVFDHFGTRNQFYGGQIGADAEIRRGPLSLGVRAQVALGTTHESVDILGTQLIHFPGDGVRQFQGGLLALSSNSGHHSRDRFSVVPEASVTLGYQVTERVRLTAGYNFLYWSNVFRPGDQIDRNLDAARIPNFCNLDPTQCPHGLINPPHPQPTLRETGFWAQGISLGLELKF